MEFRKLSSLQVPAMGMGTYSTFDVTSESDISVRHQIIENCIEHDVTFVDSSPMYGNSEKVVGITTEGRRDKFQFATKVWCRGREEGEAQIARSFELLRTDYIEVFQIHNLVNWPTHLSTLERLKDEGKIGLVGITRPSNLEWSQDQGETELMGTSQPPNIAYPTMMEIMRSGRIDVVQIPYNVGDRNCEDELLPLAEDLGVGVIVMKPLEKGRYLTGFKRRPDLGAGATGLGAGRPKSERGDSSDLPAREDKGKRPGRVHSASAPGAARLHQGRDGAVPLRRQASGNR